MFRKKIALLIIFLFLSYSAQAESADTSAVIDDLTIIVNSCDKYKDCWTPFCTLLHRYWPGLKTHNKHIPVILIINEEDFSFPGITVHKTGQDKSWSDNMLEVLAKVQTKKVLYLQEDYFLSSFVNEASLKKYVDAIQPEKIGYVGITSQTYFANEPLHPLYNEAYIKSRFMIYRTSLQPALWSKDLLTWMIMPGEDPWRFEIDGSARSNGSRREFITLKENFPFGYLNACQLGFWAQVATDFLNKEGIEVKNLSLPIKEDYPLTFKLKNMFPKYFKYWGGIMGLFDKHFA